MLKDVTFGQYMYGQSAVHKLDPRLKLIFTVMFIVMLFSSKTLWGFAVNAALVLMLYLIAGIPFKMALKSIKPILPIVLFTGILNLFFYVGGDQDPLVDFWIIRIYPDGVMFTITLALRISILVAGTAILTYTTSPIELTDAIERLLRPFKYLKLPVHELAMIMTIALRFIPLLIDETMKIMNAQKSRGADLESGGLFQRVKALVPILVPLFVSSIRPPMNPHRLLL